MAMMERLRMKTIGTSIMVVQDQTSYVKVGVVIELSRKAHMVLAVNIYKYMKSEPEKRSLAFLYL